MVQQETVIIFTVTVCNTIQDKGIYQGQLTAD